MKVFFDTEFLEDGQTIDLISVGMIREDGKTLYRVSSEFNERRALRNEWIAENVLKDKIVMGEQRYTRTQIAADILEYLADVEKPEFWAYVGAYDWVALCQLYGPMVARPSGWPTYCRDLKQVTDRLNMKPREQLGLKHHALLDAVWVRESYDSIRQFCIKNLHPMACPV